MKKIDGDKIGLYYGIITIVDTERGIVKKVFLTARGTEDDEFISLNKCLEIIGANEKNLVLVILEEPLHGEIYQYGNNEIGCWEWHGTTKGYA